MGEYRLELTHLTEDEMTDKSYMVRISDSATWRRLSENFWECLTAMGFYLTTQDLKEDEEDWKEDLEASRANRVEDEKEFD